MKYSINHTEYFNSSNEEVPSATTILKILNKPGISSWANSLGFRHLKYENVLNERASLGTEVHSAIHSFLTNKYHIFINKDGIDINELKFHLSAFMDWYNKNTIETILSEQSFSTNKFGGTIDFYGIVNDKLTILDFKTSKKIRMSMFIQLALYIILLESHGYKVEQVGIVLTRYTTHQTKFISRESMNKYVDIAQLLIDAFHLYYNINEEDEWSESVI